MFEPDKRLENDFQEWFEQNKPSFLQDLADLIGIPSVSEISTDTPPYGEPCRRVLAQALSMAETYGFSPRNHENYCGTARWATQSKTPKQIGIFTHLDVVPAGEGWAHQPFSLTQIDGYLVGRGVGDNKGPAVMALYALRYLKEHGYQLKNDWLLFFGCSEETGMEDITYYAAHQPLPDFALVPDNDFSVCYAEKGIVRMVLEAPLNSGMLTSFSAGQVVNAIPDMATAHIAGGNYSEWQTMTQGDPDVILCQSDGELIVQCKGLARHAAFPKGAVNALERLVNLLAQPQVLLPKETRIMQELAVLMQGFYGEGLAIQGEDEPSGRLTCVGTVAKLQDGLLQVLFDIRYPVTMQGADLHKAILARLQGTAFTLVHWKDDAPNYIKMDTPEAEILRAIAAHVLEHDYPPYAMGGGTYARKLPRAVGFGPGVPDEPKPFGKNHGGGHQPDECVLLDNLRKGMLAYLYAILQLDAIL